MEFEYMEELIEKYEGLLISYAHGFTRNLETAKDVVQESFIKLCKADIRRINDYVKPWLFKVTRNRCLEILRKQKKQIDLMEDTMENVKSDLPAPSLISQNNETTATLMSLIGTLPFNQREIVILKFQDDLSYKEISEVTGQSISNVGFILHTAIKKLRQKMEKIDSMNQRSGS